MIRVIILLTLSLLPGFVLAVYLYNKDKEKEPIGLLIKLFFGGILSCLMVILVNSLVSFLPIFTDDIENLNILELLINVFVGIAFVEEFCKWIIVHKFSYNHEEFDEFYDMIIYSSFVSLGFACFENIFYVFEGGISTGIVRAVLAVPGHVCDAIFMGYYLGLAKIADLAGNKKVKNKNMILSILIPMTFHGIYDFCLMSNSWILFIVFIIFIIALYIASVKKVRKISSIEEKIVKRLDRCSNCGAKVYDLYCTHCGTPVNKDIQVEKAKFIFFEINENNNN